MELHSGRECHAEWQQVLENCHVEALPAQAPEAVDAPQTTAARPSTSQEAHVITSEDVFALLHSHLLNLARWAGVNFDILTGNCW